MHRTFFLLLRMLMRDLAVPVRILAMVVSRGRVLLRLFMVGVIVVMGRLPVVMRRRLMFRGGPVMVFGGRVFLFLGHGNLLLETTKTKKADVAETLESIPPRRLTHLTGPSALPSCPSASHPTNFDSHVGRSPLQGQ
jgi:hypothetical protein